MTPVRTGPALDVTAVTAVDLEHAWVLATTATAPARWSIFRTVNGGETWTQAQIHEQSDNAAVTFVDQTHGWVQLSRMSSDHLANQLTLLRTQDGGRTWSALFHTTQRISIQPDVQVGECQWSLVRFATPLDGFAGLGCDASAAPRMDVTHDGGATWRRITLPTLKLPEGVRMFSSVERPTFAADGRAAVFGTICVGDGRSCTSRGALYRSSDGGSSWAAGSVVRAGGGAIVSDPMHAWIPDGCIEPCDSTATMLRTLDGGVNWSVHALPIELARIFTGAACSSSAALQQDWRSPVRESSRFIGPLTGGGPSSYSNLASFAGEPGLFCSSGGTRILACPMRLPESQGSANPMT